jgi:hypothetical protein
MDDHRMVPNPRAVNQSRAISEMVVVGPERPGDSGTGAVAIQPSSSSVDHINDPLIVR